MTKLAKTPRSRADTRLSNLVLEGGKKKNYQSSVAGQVIISNAKGQPIVTHDRTVQPPNGRSKKGK